MHRRFGTDAYIGRVITEEKGLYLLLTSEGTMHASVAGKIIHNALTREDYPATGDFVVIDRNTDQSGYGLIMGILERSSTFKRKVAGHTNEIQIVAVNIDVLFLTMALNKDFNLRRLERYLAAGRDSGSRIVILLTKLDLAEDLENRLSKISELADNATIILTSAVTGEGLPEIRELIPFGTTAAFIGSSGIGKSTVINSLLGEDRIRTNDIRHGDDKGKHTTTHRELILLEDGGAVIDTPGMRELHLLDDSEGVDATFSDVTELIAGCRFSDCSHNNEPGCRIREALENGTLDVKRYESYLKLQRETRHMASALDSKLRQEQKNRAKSFMKEKRSILKQSSKRKV
jgi:ribosome biogenesis GTPase